MPDATEEGIHEKETEPPETEAEKFCGGVGSTSGGGIVTEGKLTDAEFTHAEHPVALHALTR